MGYPPRNWGRSTAFITRSADRKPFAFICRCCSWFAVISDNLANRLWPNQSAVGRPLRLYRSKYVARTVGVVGAVHTSLTEEPARMVYFPDWEEADQDMSLVVRTATNPEGL